MEIIKEDGKIITKMSFSECFFGYDDPNLSKEIINIFDENLSYSYQPGRTSEKDHYSRKTSDDVGIPEIDMRCSEHSNERE